MFPYVFALLERVKVDRKGVTAMEYGVIAAGIVIIVATAAVSLGTKVSTLFANLGGKLEGSHTPAASRAESIQRLPLPPARRAVNRPGRIERQLKRRVSGPADCRLVGRCVLPRSAAPPLPASR
jgi:pilus assembly protein Flp/PilA